MKRILIYLAFFICAVSCLEREGSFYRNDLPFTGTSYLLAAMQAASGNGQVVCFLNDTNFGQFTYQSSVTVGDTPVYIERGYNGQQVYVANQSSGTLMVLNFNRATCEMSVVQTITGLTNIKSVNVNSSYLVLYAGYSGGIQKYTIASDGTLTALGAVVGFGGAIYSVVESPSQSAMYVNVDGTTLYTVTIGSGGDLTLGSTVGFTNIVSMDVGTHSNTDNSYLFVADTGLGTVRTFSINSSTEALTFLESKVVANVSSIVYFFGTYPGLFVQRSTGELRSYSQADDGTLSLFYTNTEVTDTMTPAISIENVHVNLSSVGQSGGIYSWANYIGSTGNVLKALRTTSLSAYGTQANYIKGIVIQ